MNAVDNRLGENSETTVLVAGGGPVGFVTALGLAQRGIAVELVEASETIIESPRAAVYHWSLLEGLDRLGILDEAKQRGFTKQDYCFMLFRTGERVSWTLEPLAEVTDYPYNLHLGQHVLAAIALERLSRLPNAKVHFSQKLTDISQDGDGVIATVATKKGSRTVRADWLIAADGGTSTVRSEILKMNFFGITWPERFVATNVAYDFEKYGYERSTIVMDDQYGAIIAKLDRDTLWRCTYMEDASFPVESVRERMDHVYGKLLPGNEGYHLVQHSPYRMHQRCVDTMRVGRVVLAGDAAHITNPCGGLGLTTGLYDSYFLVDILDAIVNDGASTDLLDRYSDERRRIFIELASPRATANKLRVFHSKPGLQQDEDMAQLRYLNKDKDIVLQMAMFTDMLASKFER